MPLLRDEVLAVSQPDQLASRLHSLPILILNVHSNCNCHCVMCDIWKRQTHEQIRVADLDRHRASLRTLGVRQVVLSGGEPLLHSDLGSLCKFFKQEDIHLTLLTTGLLLLKRAQDICAWFDDVIVSLDGPRDIHDRIRRVHGAFDLIAKGVAEMQVQKPGMPITCRTTIQKANHRHLRDTAAAAKNIGFQSISFLAADLTSEAFNRPLVWPGDRQSEIALTEAEVIVLEYEIQQLIQEHGGNFIAESPEKLRRVIDRFRAHLGQVATQSPLCNAPWVSAVIEVDQTVRPCFFHSPIGSIADATLDEVVNSAAARAFRQSLKVSEDPTCRRCVCSLNYHSTKEACV